MNAARSWSSDIPDLDRSHAVKSRQHEIHEDQVKHPAHSGFEPIPAIALTDNFVARTPKIVGKQASESRIILNDEDALCRCAQLDGPPCMLVRLRFRCLLRVTRRLTGREEKEEEPRYLAHPAGHTLPTYVRI